jgi:hypothetical protein
MSETLFGLNIPGGLSTLVKVSAASPIQEGALKSGRNNSIIYSDSGKRFRECRNKRLLILERYVNACVGGSVFARDGLAMPWWYLCSARNIPCYERAHFRPSKASKAYIIEGKYAED